MIIFFIFQLQRFWLQTDWSGSAGESLWVDTTSYYASKGMDGKRAPGKLQLFVPSGEWESFTLPSPGKWGNAIVETSPGVLYIGSGWDSACVFKFSDFGNSFISKSNLGAGEVLSLVVLPNTNILDTCVLVGTKSGKLYIGKNTAWQDVANFNAPILKLYQPPVGWVYLGTADGKIYISLTEGWSWFPAPGQPANTKAVFDIFESSNGKFYACTKLSNNKGQIFWSHDDGEHWDSLYTFPNTEAVYSICETSDHNLYVSTGYQGKIFTSSDSGKHWQEVSSPASPAEFYHIFSDANDILYVGGKCTVKIPKGMVFMSKDKGQTWDTLFVSPGWRPTQIVSLMQSKSGIIFAGGDTTAVFRSGYCNSGWLEASIYDAFENQLVVNRSMKFGFLHFIGSGFIGVRVRSSFTLDSMPAWGDLVPSGSNPVNYGSANDGDRYIQYRIELTGLPLSSPILDEITLKYKIDIEGPVIDSAVAFDGDSADTSIDVDDYVVLWFNEPTNTPWIETSNIDQVLKLSNGHSWRSDSGRGVIKYPGQWITPSILKICLSTMRMGDGEGYPPTIAVGDTIYPDSLTIQDKWDNPCLSPRVIKGGFGIEEHTRRTTQDARLNLEIFPNPFVRVTGIKYQVPTKSKVSLKVYNVAGRLIKTLVDEDKPAGLYYIEFQGIGPGIYFVKMETKFGVLIQKLIGF